MELKNIFKIAPLTLIVVGISMLAMNSNQQTTKIKILTSDEQEIEIPKDIAFESSMIKEMAGDVGESNMLIIPITGRSLSLIVSILQAINAAPNATKLKRADGQYIAQRIQPLIDNALAGADNQALAQVIYTAEFLDLGQITNGTIRVIVQKALAVFPMATIASIKSIWTTYNINWPDRLDPILEYQYQLVKNGNIPELSVKDYIAINGMPEVEKSAGDLRLELRDKQLTSLEGMRDITNIETAKFIGVGANPLKIIPANIFNGLTNLEEISFMGDKFGRTYIDTLPATIFSGLKNLQIIDLMLNRLETLPPTIFNGLTNLKILELANNRLKTLPDTLFKGLTNLETLGLSPNPLETLPATIFSDLVSLKRIDIFSTPGFKNMKRDQFRKEFNLGQNVNIAKYDLGGIDGTKKSF